MNYFLHFFANFLLLYLCLYVYDQQHMSKSRLKTTIGTFLKFSIVYENRNCG